MLHCLLTSMFIPGIYRAYDIRGIVPDEFDPTEAYHIGRAYAQHTGARRVVVARDMRTSGEEIFSHLTRGLTEAGVDVVAIGQATSPLFYFAVHTLKAEGGLMVTASHNPARYNGIKMTRAEAVPIAGDTGLTEIRDLVKARAWSPAARAGTVSEATVLQEYIDLVTHEVSAQGLTIVIDAGNGMAGLPLPHVRERIGGTVIPLYWELDGTFPHHEADPLKEENMRDVQAAVHEHTADLGVAFDGDGDRVFFCTEEGVTVPGDIATALIAREVLRDQPGKPIIFDVRASRTTSEVIREAGGQPIMWKVGHSLIKPKMRETGAPFAGEVSGHFYFAPWYAESGLLAMGYIIRLLQAQKKPFSEIVRPLLKYPKTAELNYTVSDKDAVLAALKAKYADANITDIDGVRIEYPTWWASVRASNTEPLLRLNLEADTPELVAEKQKEIEAIVHQGA